MSVPNPSLDLVSDPVAEVRAAFTRAAHQAPCDHSAVALATVTADGQPTVRMVLLRRLDADGFLFFTNYGSRKARELDQSGRAALCLHWQWLEEQIRIEGRVRRATDAESDEYFASRPHGHQVAAWASRQSEPLLDRTLFEARYRALEAEYEGRLVPRPPFWGGYRLVPDLIEFWKGALNRLHDRVVYRRNGAVWTAERQYP